MTLGEFRAMTKDMPDDTLILKEASYPQVEHVVFHHKEVGSTEGVLCNHPFVDRGYKQKYWQGNEWKEQHYPLTPKALVISRYEP
jgi:hypothetical protein